MSVIIASRAHSGKICKGPRLGSPGSFSYKHGQQTILEDFKSPTFNLGQATRHEGGGSQYVLMNSIQKVMAGPVRQTIDVGSLSIYLAKNVADIELPISLKQVSSRHFTGRASLNDRCFSLASVSQILLTSSAQPMDGNMYYERNHLVSCCPGQHTRSSVNSASSTP